MSSPAPGSSRGTPRGKRIAEKPPSRRQRAKDARAERARAAQEARRRATKPTKPPKPTKPAKPSGRRVLPDEPATRPPVIPLSEPRADPDAEPTGAAEVEAADETRPDGALRRPAGRGRRFLTFLEWLLAFVVLLGGLGALVVAVVGRGPTWLDGAGATAVITAISWALAKRTGGRAYLSAALALTLGAVAVLVGGAMLRTGAAVMTCAVGGVYAVMATVPAVNLVRAVREVLIAAFVSGATALAAVGFEPTVVATRFDYASLLVALVLVFALVHRLGAGLHGLGRRGIVVVAVGFAVLVLTLAYAEMLRRYSALSAIESLMQFVDWTTARIGAFPRPLVVLLGIPALVWGCHMRARRRQGWWVCAFGVAATVPLAQLLVDPDGSFVEAGLRALYSIVLGLALGYLVVRVDLALTGSRGRGGRRAEEAAAHRPEPRRFAEL